MFVPTERFTVLWIEWTQLEDPDALSLPLPSHDVAESSSSEPQTFSLPTASLLLPGNQREGRQIGLGVSESG